MTLHQLVVLAGVVEILALAAVLAALGLPGGDGVMLRLPLRRRRSWGQLRPARAKGVAAGPSAPTPSASGPPATAPPGNSARPRP